MKKLLKTSIPKSYVLCLGLITLFLFGTYYSYALFTIQKEAKNTIKIISGNLYSKLTEESNDPSAYKRILLSSKTQFTIQPNEEKTVRLKVENINNRDAKFNLYYEASEKENFKIGYLDIHKTIPSSSGFVLQQDESEEFLVRMHNTGTKLVTVVFNSDVGLADKPLAFPTNKESLEVYPLQDGEAVTTLLAKANQQSSYMEDTQQELYPIEVNSTKQKNWEENQKVDYRYIGENPNNLVLLQQERYRIIGIFNTKDEYGMIEKRIKLVKEAPIAQTSFPSTENNLSQDSLVQKKLHQFYESLEETTQSMISPVEWYLGDLKDLNFQDLYQQERSNSDEKTDLLASVAPLYGSDYQYSYALGFNDDCFTRNQNCRGSYLDKMMQGNGSWFLSYDSRVEQKDKALSLDNAQLNFSVPIQTEQNIYPSFYLKTQVKLVGNGTEESPYQFQL